jgi:hypothetical protein
MESDSKGGGKQLILMVIGMVAPGSWVVDEMGGTHMGMAGSWWLAVGDWHIGQATGQQLINILSQLLQNDRHADMVGR